VKYKILCILLIVCLISSACEGKASEKTIEDVKRELLTMEAYSCDVTMKITNNKSTMEYKMKHLYKAPSRYRIEVAEPQDLKGQTIIYDGKEAWVYHPDIKTHLKMESFDDSVQHDAFVGSFIYYFKLLDRAKLEKVKLQNKEYYVLELEIPEDNKYMCKEKLWIEIENSKPYKIEIYGKDNTITAQVLFDNFKTSIKLDDSLFTIAN
jgi:outer membrane lipoprotein-sorting protein